MSSSKVLQSIALLTVLAGTAAESSAQNVDLTVFLGRAYPIYDDRLRFTARLPVLPRLAVRETGPLEITTEGGAALGAAVAVEFGLLSVEGRLDATDVGFAVNGTRYDLFATAPATTHVGSLTIGDGRLDAERLKLLSVNLRLRTPGHVGLVASGGLSYLPSITITGTVPVTVEAPDLVSPATVTANLRLLAAPGEENHKWGFNAGAGVRIGGDRLALVAEARAFYFREFDLRLAAPDGPDLLSGVANGIPAIRFEPVVVNAQVGVVFRF
jgi:hypothetical protein